MKPAMTIRSYFVLNIDKHASISIDFWSHNINCMEKYTQNIYVCVAATNASSYIADRSIK